ncbi:hypothetical protein TNIN_370131 [Trichonephila inaurata madagascariensis]|uniref:Uncharacterized protein n=1 Tax=Trichonephila inaurata madagascariensis TaxID=2747483 RepID=A0A8X6X7T8_9ARAC|nr:hypothetical protein TNIN_370131 [Trichonephila inaurata madagascariensis]
MMFNLDDLAGGQNTLWPEFQLVSKSSCTDKLPCAFCCKLYDYPLEFSKCCHDVDRDDLDSFSSKFLMMTSSEFFILIPKSISNDEYLVLHGGMLFNTHCSESI